MASGWGKWETYSEFNTTKSDTVLVIGTAWQQSVNAFTVDKEFVCGAW